MLRSYVRTGAALQGAEGPQGVVDPPGLVTPPTGCTRPGRPGSAEFPRRAAPRSRRHACPGGLPWTLDDRRAVSIQDVLRLEHGQDG